MSESSSTVRNTRQNIEYFGCVNLSKNQKCPLDIPDSNGALGAQIASLFCGFIIQ